MSRSKFDRRPVLNDRVAFVLTDEQKRAAFAAANREGLGLSEFIRNAIAKASVANSSGDPDRPAAA